MYKTRQKQLLQYVQQELQTDAVIMMVPKNIYYFTGFAADPHERFFALYVDAKNGKTILFLPSLDETAAIGVAQVDEIVPVSDTEDPYKLFAQKTHSNVTTFAIEKGYMTVEQMELFQRQLNDFMYTDIEACIKNMRARKSMHEVDKVKQAIQIAEKALQHTWGQIQTGMTELDIKAELEYQMTVLGADAIAFETIVLTGSRSALPHGSASNTEVQHGDFLLFDFGVTKDGYHSDLTRTCMIGEGTKEQEKIYHTVLKANQLAIESVKVGDMLQTIDQSARTYIEEQGYGQFFTHRIGHGLGLDVHEYPSIHLNNEEKITEGLLFTVEPGIYVPDIGGVRIEDDIYIDENGQVNVLSSFTKELTYV